MITGAGSWLGQNMAINFSELSANVSIIGRNAKSLTGTTKLSGKNGSHIDATVLDINDQNKLKQFISKLDGLDILIANAAIYPIGTVSQGDESTWQDVIEI